MIRLRQTFGAHAGRVLELQRDVIRFGRLPDNDVVFDAHADLDASGRHAEMRREGTQWVLVDIGSRNGTLIAGRRVTRHVLQSGDEVEFGLGGPRIRVELPTVAPPMNVRADAATAAATPIAPHPAPAPSTPAPGPAAYDVPTPLADPSAEKRYGHRTVGMMIQAAVEQAQRASGSRHSTAFFRAVATEAAQRSSRGLQIAVALLALLFLFTVAAVVALFLYAHWQEQGLRDENVRLQRRLAAVDEGESTERVQAGGRLSGLNGELDEAQGAPGARIAETNDRVVHALVADREGGRELLCSAFSVRPHILATSAQCVSAIERAAVEGRAVQVLSPHETGTPRRVQQMWRHPSYIAGEPSPDVGLVRVDRATPQHARLATPAEAAALRVGDDLFAYGFPQQNTDVEAPRPTLSHGLCGRLTALDGRDAEAPHRHLVTHSASAVHGPTAGGPIFDRDGRVIAVDTGNIERDASEVGTSTGEAADSEISRGRGVRVDLLLQLLAGLSP